MVELFQVFHILGLSPWNQRFNIGIQSGRWRSFPASKPCLEITEAWLNRCTDSWCSSHFQRWHTTGQKWNKHTVAFIPCSLTNKTVLNCQHGLLFFLRQDAEGRQRMHGNAWMESGRVDSREVCGCFAADGCVKACHTKPSRSTLSVNFPGCFLNTESASLPGQRHSQNVTATHTRRPRAHTHTQGSSGVLDYTVPLYLCYLMYLDYMASLYWAS